MNISSLSIKRPVGVFTVAIAVVVLGLFFLKSLSVDLLPKITYPMIRIAIDWKGASPYEIEENIARKVEASVATAEDAVKVVSNSINGNVSLDVYFDFGKDMDIALQDTRAKLDQVRNLLPDDADEPKIFKADPSQLPITEIAVFSKARDERELRQWVENDISNYFLGIPGLGSVVTSGGRIREIQVLFDQAKLQNFELSAEQVLNSLKAENIEAPAGRATFSKREYNIRLLAKYEDVDDISSIIVANREGRYIRLADIATVSDSYAEQRVLTRLNGQPCVMMSFFKQPNANTVSVASKIEKRAGQLKKKKILPDDVGYAVASSQAYYIVNSIKNVGSSAVIGGILAIFVVGLFLHSIKRTFIISVAIPVSILGTFILMGLSGLTLNLFSLGGLVLAVGMLLDNSIVMIENITRHQKDSPDPAEAARMGSGEVIKALTASTLTNLAAIVPFFFIKGLASLLFRDLTITVTVAFIVSLLVSLTVVPCLSAYLIRNDAAKVPPKKHFMDGITAAYKSILQTVLGHRVLVFAGAAGILLVSIFMFKQLGKEFLPAIDDGKITVRVKLPTGTALQVADPLTRKLENIIKATPGIKTIYTMSGGYWLRRNIYEKANESEIQVQLVDKSVRPLPTAQAMKILQKKIKEENLPRAKVKVMRTPLRGIRTTSTSDVDIRVKGYNLDTLYGIATDIHGRIKDVAGLSNTDVSLDFSEPELHVILDRKKMNDLGLSAKSVADTLRMAVYGAVNTQFTDTALSADYDIRLLVNPVTLNTRQSVEDIALYPRSGAKVRLKDVAKVKVAEGPVQIDRENQVRLIGVTGDAGGKNVGVLTGEIKKRLSSLKLPEGYTLEYGGEAESMSESNRQLLVVIALAIFLVFAVMAVQFESFVDPLVIMASLPLALVGAVALLFITHTPFGATVFLGLILLVGIVVNNAIVLIEYIHTLRREKGLSVYDAVSEAAPVRLRPILMTSLTTIVGLIPLALGWGEGLEMLRPMAIVMIGGLLSAMLLTLLVVPSLYITLHRGGKYQ